LPIRLPTSQRAWEYKSRHEAEKSSSLNKKARYTRSTERLESFELFSLA
jgi:hypothetical protein